MEDLGQCSVRVAPNTQWGAFQQHQCYKKATIIRDGKPYCKIHDPEYIKQKDTKMEATRKANGCQSCGRGLRRWWNYCPHCGSKTKD